MANTTPEHPGIMRLPTVGTSDVAGDRSLFGDPNLALFGGFGYSSSLPSSVSSCAAPLITAGTPPANDGM